MPKKIVAMKVDEARKTALEQQAKEQGKTITDILLEGLDNATHTHFLKQQIQELHDKNQELEAKYMQATGHKVNMQKRITVPVTDREYQIISKAAAEAKLSRGRFVRSVLIDETRPAPALVKR